MARGKPPLWVGWVRPLYPDAPCGAWCYHSFTGKSRMEVRDKVSVYYGPDAAVSVAILRYEWGRPNGDTTIDQYGVALDDDP